MLTAISVALVALVSTSAADIINLEYAAWDARGVDDDLFRFVTRPDLTPPKLDVFFHKREKTAPGYLFVAPYDCLSCGQEPVTTYTTQQVGPHIYTSDGELVWSGIDLFPGRKVFDLHPVTIDGAYYLQLVAPQTSEWHSFSDGAAILLNASYDVVNSLTSTDLGYKIDLHEFNILDDGRTALIPSKEPREDLRTDGVDWTGIVMENFFMEIDLRSNEKLFSWRASDHVDLLESSNPPPEPDSEMTHWDWFHLNSLDKDRDGNYLVSSRATNTIFLVSPSGSIIWRLGGPKSSFTQDFDFSRQHHARIRRQTERHTIISFFDNAADDSGLWEPTASESSLLIVDLDVESMTATLDHRHPRPDGGLSQAKGNVEYLPNGNILGGWGENAYVSEYSKNGGELVYEAQFASSRFANYRTYKMDFVAQPSTKPDAKAFVSANARGVPTTRIYVSWNGATEVTSWNFYSHTRNRGVSSVLSIGSTAKSGFETVFLALGHHSIVFAEAIDVYGNSLANSSLAITEIPLGFHDADAPLRSSSHSRNSVSSGSNSGASTLVAFIAGIALTISWSRFVKNRPDSAWRGRPLPWMYKGE